MLLGGILQVNTHLNVLAVLIILERSRSAVCFCGTLSLSLRRLTCQYRKPHGEATKDAEDKKPMSEVGIL